MRYRPAVEPLETRTVPSITFSGPGDTGMATITGTPAADHFVIQLKAGDSTMIEFSDNGGTTFTDAVLANITGVTVNGLGGADQLILHMNNGLVAQAGAGLSIAFDGGTGFNTVVITGNPGVSVTETLSAGTSANAGTLDITSSTMHSAHLQLTHVGHIFDTMNADTLTINGNDKNKVIAIGGGRIPVNGVMTNSVVGFDFSQLDDDGSFHDDLDRMDTDMLPTQGDDSDLGHGEANPFEQQVSRAFIGISFANKTNLVVNGVAGNNLFVLNVVQAAAGLQSVTLNGGTGTLNVLAQINFPMGVTLTTMNIQRTETARDMIFVDEQFEMRLARPAEDAALNAFRQLLDTQGRLPVVAAIDQSLEARGQFVIDVFVRFLGRMPSAAEVQAFANALVSGAATEEQVIEVVLGSPEFFNHAQTVVTTGTPTQNLVQALFMVALGRAGSTGEMQAFTNAFANVGQGLVVAAVVNSMEFRSNFVFSLFANVLHRIPAFIEIPPFAIPGVDLLTIREVIESSMEAFNEA
jgi:hypothetical protein